MEMIRLSENQHKLIVGEKEFKSKTIQSLLFVVANDFENTLLKYAALLKRECHLNKIKYNLTDSVAVLEKKLERANK